MLTTKIVQHEGKSFFCVILVGAGTINAFTFPDIPLWTLRKLIAGENTYYNVGDFSIKSEKGMVLIRITVARHGDFPMLISLYQDDCKPAFEQLLAARPADEFEIVEDTCAMNFRAYMNSSKQTHDLL